MKKLNLFVVAMVAMLGFSMNAKAANEISLSCEKTTLKIEESTTCTVSLTLDTDISVASVRLSASDTLDISNVTPNKALGWTQSTTAATAGTYTFNNTAGKSGALFSFTVKLNSKAKELGKDDSCGNLCISAATIKDASGNPGATPQGVGTCFEPTVVEETCVGEKCNPETGSFANYAIIIASILIAGAAVIVARKSTKFFRV